MKILPQPVYISEIGFLKAKITYDWGDQHEFDKKKMGSEYTICINLKKFPREAPGPPPTGGGIPLPRPPPAALRLDLVTPPSPPPPRAGDSLDPPLHQKIMW